MQKASKMSHEKLVTATQLAPPPLRLSKDTPKCKTPLACAHFKNILEAHIV
jgi:hypothetical protein